MTFILLHCVLAHIFFDDATELNEDEEYIPNIFVRTFLDVIDEAGRFVSVRLQVLLRITLCT